MQIYKIKNTRLKLESRIFHLHKIFYSAYGVHFVQPKALNELTFLATIRPKNWFNAALSYSPIQAGGKSFGLALKLGGLFIGTDYMYFGSNSKAVNGFIGLSIPLGKNKPTDDAI